MRDVHCRAAALKILHMSQSISLDWEQKTTTRLSLGNILQQFYSILKRNLDSEGRKRGNMGPVVWIVELSPHPSIIWYFFRPFLVGRLVDFFHYIEKEN